MHKAFLLAFVFVTLSNGATTRFDIRDLNHRNLLSVISDATLERTVAMSSLVAGWIELDPENLASGIKGSLEVDLRALDTGIEIRNSILKEKLLDVSQYPTAVASLEKWDKVVTGKLGEGGGTYLADAVVKYHDRVIPVTLPLKLAYFRESEITRQRLPGNLLKVSATWNPDLGQLGIAIPDNLKSVIAKAMEIRLDAVGSDKLPVGSVVMPDGPKPKERDPGSEKKK